MRNTLTEEKLKDKFESGDKEKIERAVQDALDWLDKNQLAEKDKFESGDKEKIERAVQDALDWLDKNQLAEKDEFEAKQKGLEGVVNPIMMKVYQAAGGGGDMP